MYKFLVDHRIHRIESTKIIKSMKINFGIASMTLYSRKPVTSYYIYIYMWLKMFVYFSKNINVFVRHALIYLTIQT